MYTGTPLVFLAGPATWVAGAPGNAGAAGTACKGDCPGATWPVKCKKLKT